MLRFPLKRLTSNWYFSGAGIFIIRCTDFQLISQLVVEGLILTPSCGWCFEFASGLDSLETTSPDSGLCVPGGPTRLLGMGLLTRLREGFGPLLLPSPSVVLAASSS